MRIPLMGLGQLSATPYVTAKYMQNMYAEQRPQGEKSSMVAYQTPGLTLFTDFGINGSRGGIEFEPDSVAYVVHGDTLWEVNNAGVQTNVGTLLTTSGRVSMSHNGTQVAMVDGTYMYVYNTSTNTFAQVTDPDLFAQPTTITFLTGRFVVSFAGSGRFQWSALYDGLAWDALDFATAEYNPDNIVSVWASNGQLVLSGPETMEFWGNSGTIDAAFIPLQGTPSEWGLAAVWSQAKYDNSFACLVKNRMGQVMVAQIANYLPKKLSTVDLDKIINGYASTSDATAYSYMLGGHPMYVISFPSAGATWLYDGSTGIWSKLKSYNDTRHVGEFSFNLVGKTLLSGYNNGRIYELTPTALDDNGDSIERQIVSETIAAPGLEDVSIYGLRLDMEVGNGLTLGQGSNPQIGLEISRDNGNTWGAQVWKSFGEIGKYLTRVEWRRLGTARAFTFRFTVTDPVSLVLVSATVNPND